MKKIGILAYGSLIDEPGPEIGPVIDYHLEDETPFRVEFARESRTRGGAPTLVPVEEGGSTIKAIILVLKEYVSEEEAKDMLYRREINKTCSQKKYDPPDPCVPKGDRVCIEEDNENFPDLELVLYTKIAPTPNLTPEKLASLAIKSARSKFGAQRRDGISYLIDIKSRGNKTPLMDKYEEKILDSTKTSNLEEAWEACRRDHC